MTTEPIFDARPFEDSSGDLAIGAWLKNHRNPFRLVQSFNWSAEQTVNDLCEKINKKGLICLDYWRQCSSEDFRAFDDDGFHASKEGPDLAHVYECEGIIDNGI